jgi:hypothetical protein
MARQANRELNPFCAILPHLCVADVLIRGQKLFKQAAELNFTPDAANFDV